MDLLDVVTRHRIYRPDKLAVVGASEQLTYRELNDQAERLADNLRRGCLRPGWRVAIMLPNDVTFVVAYAGIRRAGGVLVPINLRLSVEEILYQLEHSQASLLLLDPEWPDAKQLRAATSVPAVSISDLSSIETWNPDVRLLPPDDDCPADVERIMYTSGTTSRPKGVMLNTEQIWWGSLTRCVDFGLTAEDVTLTVAPLYHVGGLDSFTTPILLAGGTVVLCRRFDPARVLTYLHSHGVTCTWLAPTLLRELFAAVDRGAVSDAPRLRVILGGGEKAPAPVLERLAEVWPDAGYFDAYGLTECQGIATFLPASHSRSHLGSVGRPAIGRRLAVVSEDGRPCGTGEPGEIRIAGPVVSPGYWLDPTATSKAQDGEWLLTGDIGTLDEDGFLTVVDRKKDMIRSGLENVASSEIERVLYSHPAVEQAAVVARRDDQWGEVPVAYVVIEEEIDGEELRTYCRERLAGFKVPAMIHVLDALPRTASGKIQKHVLREQERATAKQ